MTNPMSIDTAELRKLSDQIESAVDSLKNPFDHTSREQEEAIIAAAENLGPALDEIDRLTALLATNHRAYLSVQGIEDSGAA